MSFEDFGASQFVEDPWISNHGSGIYEIEGLVKLYICQGAKSNKSSLIFVPVTAGECFKFHFTSHLVLCDSAHL